MAASERRQHLSGLLNIRVIGCLGLASCLDFTHISSFTECTPNTRAACQCSDGRPAQKTCNAAGNAYGDCECACATGTGDCDGIGSTGCETDLTTSVHDCGACGNDCAALPQALTASCVGGACVFSCGAGFADCDASPSNGCETSLQSPTNCGACARACAAPVNAIATCTNATCGFACGAGYADCDSVPDNGCETSLTAVQTCGACGNDCLALPNVAAATTCSTDGQCLLTCINGCTDADADPSNGCEACLPTTVAAANLVLWLTGDTYTSQTLTWSDQSGQHNDASCGSTVATVCPTTTAVGGLNVLSFGGSNAFDILSEFSAPGSDFANGEGITEVVVFKSQTIGGFYDEILQFNSNNANPDLVRIDLGHGYDLSGVPQLLYQVCPNGGACPFIETAGFNLSWNRVILVHRSDETVSVLENGQALTIVYPDGPQPDILLPPVTSRAYNSIGYAKTNPSHDHFSGLLAEIVVFDRALVQSEVAEIDAYLKNKWKLP